MAIQSQGADHFLAGIFALCPGGSTANECRQLPMLAAGAVCMVSARRNPYEKAPGTCRMESQVYLEPHVFSRLTSARCYKYMPSLAFKNASRLTYCRKGWLCRGECDGECFQPYGNDSDVQVLETFKKGLYADRWKSCCRAARDCCQEMIADDQAGLSATKEMSKKTCWENGTWFYSQEYGKEYTFYDCGSLEYHRSMTIFSIVLHSLSVVVLVPAIAIFSVYKQLQVHRISLHKNFCVAMVLYDISVILVDAVFILDHVSEEKNIRVNENPNLCKVLYTLSRYFRLCQYAWMFCEGFYLHKLIASAFAEQKSLLVFYVIGWGCPAIFVSISAVLRAVRIGHPKAVRAVLVLFPLFGMHFLMTVYRSPANCGAWEIYQYISKASDGLQVLYLLRRSYGRYRLQRGFSSRRGNSLAMTRMSVSTHVTSLGDSLNPNNGSVKKYSGVRNGDTAPEEQPLN
ncbi:hypothetical protein HPB49_024791 [Dermacentor silvarum]|uniref:Uncharacterized protein n=1 Tax=Dermacentor silvarum TaxID=543639 RepID=A0ACB8DHF9_DERSI|nr:hypothetical protein HPB49_024791 [Dermacentor silvarum]